MGCGAVKAHDGTTVNTTVVKVAEHTPTTTAPAPTSPQGTGDGPTRKSSKTIALDWAAASNEKTGLPQYEGEEVATFGEESFVCRTRRGSSLRYQTILKCDQFPSAQNQKLAEKLADAANFRQVEGYNVFGVGQPGVEGMSDVLRRILQTKGVDKVAWFNMREEPLIYINSRPYCVKHRATPFNNQESTGIDIVIVERIEDDLRREILAESERFDGRILLHGETKPPQGSEVAAWGKPYCYWEKVTPESVVTVRSVANKLIADGLPLTFYRIPITDEKTPQLKDFDQVVDCLAKADPSIGIVFNCQLGRGRTTTGMALAVMSQGVLLKRPSAGNLIPIPKAPDNSFAAVAALLEFFEGADAGKADVDAALDKCAHMQHLRDAIITKRGTKHEAVGLCYLERYIFLILLATFAREQVAGADVAVPTISESGFERWVTNHSHRSRLYSLLDHMTLDSP